MYKILICHISNQNNRYPFEKGKINILFGEVHGVNLLELETNNIV